MDYDYEHVPCSLGLKAQTANWHCTDQTGVQGEDPRVLITETIRHRHETTS